MIFRDREISMCYGMDGMTTAHLSKKVSTYVSLRLQTKEAAAKSSGIRDIPIPVQRFALRSSMVFL
jgi:hypothetical protein